MPAPSTIHTALYAVGCFWSFITWIVAAALVGKWNSLTKYWSGSFEAANASLAWGLLLWLYYAAALAVLLFVSPENVFRWNLVDVSALSFFFIFGLGAIGALSSSASWFREWNRVFDGSDATLGGLGQATIALGWLQIFLVLGTLVYQVYFILAHYGRDFETWKTSFYNLTAGEAPARRSKSETASNPAEVATA